MDATAFLQTTHINQDVKDEFHVERVDFDENETTVYCSVLIRADPSFPGHVGNDYKITLKDGTVLNAIRIEGVPVNEDFDRHGDWVTTPYQVIFPAISHEQWSKGTPVFSGSVCHEPVSVKLLRQGKKDGEHSDIVDNVIPGKYEAFATIMKKVEGENFVLRPMNCPHHMRIFANRPHSYKELPIRIAEIAHDFFHFVRYDEVY